MTRRLWALLGLLSWLVLACGRSQPPQTPAATAIVQAAGPAPVARSDEGPPTAFDAIDTGDLGPIPVTRADPIRGRQDALVTIVEFAEFQCPFCGRVEATLDKLLQNYGPSKLRLVWKNSPLDFHPLARPTGVVARVVFERRGNDAFWRAHDAFFEDQRRLDETLNDAAALAGGTLESLKASSAWGSAEAKIDGDMALGRTLGASGVPAFFVNGVFISGAQPYEKFAAVIDDQIAKATDALAHGTPMPRLYAELTKRQYKLPKDDEPDAPPPEDHRPRRMPVGTSPVRGNASALVTIVMLSDFQCPYCGRVVPTVKQIEAEYRDNVRVVFKHNPLPFHPHAEPAAEFALEARAEKGDRGFWAAYEMLFAKACVGSPAATSRQACMDAGGTWEDHQQRLEDADLAAYATALGLSPSRVAAAIASKKYAAIIEEDQELAEEAGASGTPSFFINGRKLVGAQPIEAFRAVIDEELARAKQLVAQGVPAARLYVKLQEAAAGRPEPERRMVPAPTGANPSRGPANAKVTIQMFADFQCPFCARVLPTLAALEKAYPNKIRVVWRNLPLPFHANATPAAEAAMEAFRQKGSPGFWAMHDLLYANGGAGLERPALDGYASQLGLDLARFAAALDTHTHQAELQAETKLAHDASISGTPFFLVNGYVVNGAQPYKNFRRVVERALAEAR